MKNYKNIVPIALIAFMIISVYMMIQEKNELQQEYNGYLAAARKYAKEGIITDAVTNYELALEMDDSIELFLEIGQMFVDNGLENDVVSWGEKMMETFPKDVRAYEYALKAEFAECDYEECFELIQSVEARKLNSDLVKEIYNEIKYTYELGDNEYEEVMPFCNGYCAVYKEGLWGYADEKGSLAIKRNFVTAGQFGNDMAPVEDQEGNHYFIDGSGNIKKKIPDSIKCESVGVMSSGFICIYNRTTYDYYDYNFNYMFGGYKYASGINNGVAAVMDEESWYIINDRGERVSDDTYEEFYIDEIGLAFRGNRGFAKKNGEFILIDTSGNRIGNDTYEEVREFTGDGLAAVRIDGKWGFIDNTGEIVIEPEYEAARSFVNGYAAISKGGRWGYITTDNNLCIEYTFEECKDFNSNGRTFVKTQGSWVRLKFYKS